jgi:hypothetical protein
MILDDLFGSEEVLLQNGYSFAFLDEMVDQMLNFNNGAGHASVVFAIGRALKGHVDNEKRTIFVNGYKFDTLIGPANQALHFYDFQLQSYRKAVDCWTIMGLRNKVVKDLRKMIGKMIWRCSIFGKEITGQRSSLGK